MENNIILVDIGNTNIKVYKNGIISHVNISYLSFLPTFYYINVNKNYAPNLLSTNGINIENYFKIDTEYEGMGIDRIALCSIIPNAIIIDAGSAMTIDKMRDNKHLGGVILLGLKATRTSFANISNVLDKNFCSISLDSLPKNTDEALSYGVFKTLKLLIDDMKEDLPIYFTGGDGKLLSNLFKNSIYDELLIFKAMENVLKLQNSYN